MSNVLQFRRRGASREVIDKLVELGYLKRAMRHNAGAIENALAQLRDDLCRSQVISESDQPGSYQTATMGKIP
jgi:transcription elongation GreA/GreB family factor